MNILSKKCFVESKTYKLHIYSILHKFLWLGFSGNFLGIPVTWKKPSIFKIKANYIAVLNTFFFLTPVLIHTFQNMSTILLPRIKDTLNAFDDFKNKQQKCMKKCFLICKDIYIYMSWKFLQYVIHCVKTQILKKNYFGKNKRCKKCTFFFRELELISFAFNSQFLYDLMLKVHPSKTVYRIFHFRFRFIFTKVFIFAQ